MKKASLLAAAIATVALASPATAAKVLPFAPASLPQSSVVTVSDGEYCDWFAIATCHKSYGAAQRSANRYGARVVNTNNVDNFRNGWYCTVRGPSSKAAARSNRRSFRRSGAKTAYIKEGCNY
ncbi:MAG: hypothetical protein AAFZ01_08860 [Pseudomonadota bacterium]